MSIRDRQGYHSGTLPTGGLTQLGQLRGERTSRRAISVSPIVTWNEALAVLARQRYRRSGARGGGDDVSEPIQRRRYHGAGAIVWLLFATTGQPARANSERAPWKQGGVRPPINLLWSSAWGHEDDQRGGAFPGNHTPTSAIPGPCMMRGSAPTSLIMRSFQRANWARFARSGYGCFFSLYVSHAPHPPSIINACDTSGGR